jgi:hypothetical protein
MVVPTLVNIINWYIHNECQLVSIFQNMDYSDFVNFSCYLVVFFFNVIPKINFRQLRVPVRKEVILLTYWFEQQIWMVFQ